MAQQGPPSRRPPRRPDPLDGPAYPDQPDPADPSAAPPAWLTTKYPETLRIKEDGRPDQHGNRQQFNWADPKYRELSRAMAGQLAKGKPLDIRGYTNLPSERFAKNG